jgi:hypothetical protein
MSHRAGSRSSSNSIKVTLLHERVESCLLNVFTSDENIEDGPRITEDGFDRLVADLGIAEEDPVQFVLAWECGSQQVSVITFTEFRLGMNHLE